MWVVITTKIASQVTDVVVVLVKVVIVGRNVAPPDNVR